MQPVTSQRSTKRPNAPAPNGGDVQGLRVALRVLWFWIRVLIGILVAGALVLTCFYMAMDVANIYILTTEGMARRANVIAGVQSREDAELNKFFTFEAINGHKITDALGSDALLRGQELYDDYVIRSIEHDIAIDWLWVWPWDDEAVVTLVERVNAIDGELPNEKKSEAQMAVAGKILPPPWENARYDVTVRRVNGVWKIDRVTKVQLIHDLTPTASKQPATPGPTSAPSSITPTTEPDNNLVTAAP